jgi:hypothetical protein
MVMNASVLVHKTNSKFQTIGGLEVEGRSSSTSAMRCWCREAPPSHSGNLQLQQHTHVMHVESAGLTHPHVILGVNHFPPQRGR